MTKLPTEGGDRASALEPESVTRLTGAQEADLKWLLLSAVALIAACASLAAGERGDPTAGQCPVFAEFDPVALRQNGDPEHNARVAGYDGWVHEQVAAVPAPAEAMAATTRIRVRVPPTGMWAQDDMVTAWKDENGHWRIARRGIDYNQPPPAPVPPPYPVPQNWQQPPAPTMEERFPLFVGPADAATAERLDAFLASPCMNAEPTRFPSTLPRREGPPWVCVPDSSSMSGEVVEPGRTRLIAVTCENPFVSSDFLKFVYGSAAIEPDQVERRTSW